MGRTTIAISPETHEQLNELKEEIYGTEHATYNEIVAHLIDSHKEENE